MIPFAEGLDYPARTTKDRRDQQKLLSLVAAHALLHQRQREKDDQGRLVAAPADYGAVHALLTATLEHGHDGLSPRAARVLQLLLGHEALSTTAFYLDVDPRELRREVLSKHPRERLDL